MSHPERPSDPTAGAAMTTGLPVDRRKALQWLAAAASGLPGPVLHAQTTLPKGPGRIVVPFPPGGPSDVLARLLTAGYQRLLGLTYTVENRPGVTGNLGAQIVAQAGADGLTLLLSNTSLVMNPHLFTRTKVVDPFKELAPISALATTDFALVVPASVPERSFQDWVAKARSRAQVFYGSFGVGSANHLYGHDFGQKLALPVQHVPYKGDAPAIQDLIGGQIDFAFIAVGSAKRVGDKLRVLAVTGEGRNRMFPDAPALKDLGVAGFDGGGWLGLFAPAGTSEPVRQALARATVDILSALDAQEQLAGFGLILFGTTPERFAEMMKAESIRQAARIKASGASLD